MAYECQRCAACCRWPGQVRLIATEIGDLSAFLGMEENALIQQYTRLSQDRRGRALAEQADGACTFLEDGSRKIQPSKPRQCRDFPNQWRFPGFEQVCHARLRERE